MGVIDTLVSVFAGSEADDGGAGEPERPSHRCPSCGEEYFADPQVDIPTCRSCGGTKAEAVA